MKRYSTLLFIPLLLLFTLGNEGCPQSKLSKDKAAVFDIQKTVDIGKDGLATIQTTRALPDGEIAEIGEKLKAVNDANNDLIDAAWSSDPDISTKLDKLTSALDSFINSSAVVKNKGSQAAIQTLVDNLTKDYKILKGK